MNKIKGPELSQLQIDTINVIKTFEKDMLETLSIITNQNDIPCDKRWMSIGITELEKGFMSIVRSIARHE